MREALALAAFTAIAAALAIHTAPGIHPDEALHLAAFRYYETHAWPPPLNSDELEYDPYGTSKVYSLELTYLLLARVGSPLRRLFDAPDFLVYRLLNVALLPLAFWPWLRARGTLPPLPGMALALLAIPQVIYVFAYANSDAFAVALSLWLFALALRLADAPTPWRDRDALWLGLLTGLLLAAKANFVFALVAPALVLLPALRRGLRPRGLARALALALLLPAPLRVVYPVTQSGQFSDAVERMHRQRAQSAPQRAAAESTAWLAERGVGVKEALIDRGFLVRTAQSLWGVYGHMNVFNPAAVYVAAGLVALLNGGLTAVWAWRRRSALPSRLRWLLLASPPVLAANLAASFYRAYTFSFQPQGRYLFPSLACIGLLLAGTLAEEDEASQRIRQASWVVAMALASGSLLGVALPQLHP